MADGLQAARTALSWRRTVASTVACAVLLVHQAVVHAQGWASVALLLAAMFGVVTIGLSAELRRRQDHVTPRLMRAVAAAVAVVTALALAASA